MLGCAAALYAAAAVLWRDPLTDAYTRWQQHQLAAELGRITAMAEAYSAGQVAASSTAEPEGIALAARRFLRTLEVGQPLGWIEIPRLAVKSVFVHGTRWHDLARGPGHYPGTSLPGLGRTTAIAGHRTTFGAPFRHIDRLRRTDEVVLTMPYGRFRYRVVDHRVVQPEDWSVLRPRGYDALVMSTCHPLWSASQRWIVVGRLDSVEPLAGDKRRPAALSAAP